MILFFLSGMVLGAIGGWLIGYWSRQARIAMLTAEERILRERLAGLEAQLAGERVTKEKLQGDFRLAAADAFKEKKDEIADFVADMKQSLEKTQTTVRKFEDERSQLYGRIEKTLGEVFSAEQVLSRETVALKRALTTGAGVRGPLGQMVLQDILEQSDLIRGIHFDTQVTLTGEMNQEFRPDFVIKLPGGKRLAIDAKEIGGEYLLAQESEDPEVQKVHYQKLVSNIRANFTRLGRKEYQALLDPEIPYVVMFIPNEAAIRAAFSTDHTIFQEAAQKHVIMASPVTIIPLIYLIRHSWQQNKLADNARELGEAVEVLGTRLYKFIEHLHDMRNGLQKAAQSWDGAMNSWNKKVVPQIEKAREYGGRFKETEDLPD
jgi:DNA recombination protein RmuC